jgi:hypothetical protein
MKPLGATYPMPKGAFYPTHVIFLFDIIAITNIQCIISVPINLIDKLIVLYDKPERTVVSLNA